MRWKQKAALFLALFVLVFPRPSGQASGEKDVFQKRRQQLRTDIKEGIAVIQSSERNQNNLHEFFVPNSDSHDFIFLTGLETPGATLILCPGSKDFPEILYADANPEEQREKTRIRHVFPAENPLPDISNAYSDYSLLRSPSAGSSPFPRKYPGFFTRKIKRRSSILISHVLSTWMRRLQKGLSLSNVFAIFLPNMRSEMSRISWMRYACTMTTTYRPIN